MQRFQLVNKPLEVKEPPTPRPDRKIEVKAEQFHSPEGRLEVRALQRKNVTSRKSAAARKPKGRNRKGRSQIPSLPPDLAVGGRQILSTRLRFDVTAGMTQVTITDYMLLGACGAIGTALNSIVSTVASAVKLRRLTVWPATGVECSIFWAEAVGDLFGGPDVVHDQTIPTGITSTAPVSSVPPTNSPAAMWHVPNTSPGHGLLSLTAGSGSIIDVELDFTLCVNNSPISLAVTTAVVGHMYYLPLDGATAHKAVALGRPSTF